MQKSEKYFNSLKKRAMLLHFKNNQIIANSMPNWCLNTVYFEGEPENILVLDKMLNCMKNLETTTGQGQIHPLAEKSYEGYFFQIDWEIEENRLTFRFESRWGPIPYDVLKMAQLHNLDFEYSFEESGNLLYGKYVYKDESFFEYCPSEADLNEHECFIEDEEEDYYDVDYEKLEELIDNMEPKEIPIILEV